MKIDILILIVILQLSAALALLASRYIRVLPLELLLSFSPLAAVSLITSLIISVSVAAQSSSNYRLTLAVGIAAIAVCAVSLYLSLMGHPITVTIATKQPTVTFATFNKLYTNTNIADIGDYFHQRNVDVIALEEAYPKEITNLRERLGYHYSFTSQKIGTASDTVVGIVSRYPIVSTDRLRLDNGQSLIRTVVDTPVAGKIAFYGVHLPGPFNASLYQRRDSSYLKLADYINKDSLPSVLGGDFNTTVYSPSLRQFNTLTSAAVQPTITNRWPQCSWYGYGAALCARIDHVYIPKKAQLVNVTIAPFLGSDHRAVIVEFVP